MADELEFTGVDAAQFDAEAKRYGFKLGSRQLYCPPDDRELALARAEVEKAELAVQLAQAQFDALVYKLLAEKGLHPDEWMLDVEAKAFVRKR